MIDRRRTILLARSLAAFRGVVAVSAEVIVLVVGLVERGAVVTALAAGSGPLAPS